MSRFKNWTGYRGLVVKILKYDCRAKEIKAMPKNTQSMMMLGEFQAHVDPAKVRTTMKRTNVAAFRTAPTQSIDSSFALRFMDGWGLCLGKSIR